MVLTALSRGGSQQAARSTFDTAVEGRKSQLSPAVFRRGRSSCIMQLVNRSSLYADDTKIFNHYRYGQSLTARLRESGAWRSTGLRSNRLRLKTCKKTEVLRFSTLRQLQTPPIRVGSYLIQPRFTIRDLGINTDGDLPMKSHNHKEAARCYSLLPLFRSLRLTICVSRRVPVTDRVFIYQSARLLQHLVGWRSED